MALPVEARERLAGPLRSAAAEDLPTQAGHTVPLAPDVWASYGRQLFAALGELRRSVVCSLVAATTFDEIATHVEAVLEHRRHAVGLLDALSPFAPYDQLRSHELFEDTRTLLLHVADEIMTPGQVVDHLPTFDAAAWPVAVEDDARLSTTFGVTTELTDEVGDFLPTRVFAAYVYRLGELLQQVAPHLRALRLPTGPDPLANVCVLGWIVDSPDPVVSYVAATDYLAHLTTAPPEVVEAHDQHFLSREGRSRQSRRRILSDVRQASRDQDVELRASRLADVYAGTIEGFVRHSGWALRCLQAGSWSTPPTLAPLHETLIAHGGLVGEVARSALLVEFRNGEAHEDLEWDGVAEHYLAGETAVSPEAVAYATGVGWSFSEGCRVARAAFGSLRHRPAFDPPSAGDEHRASNVERAVTSFGTNGLVVVSSNFNAAVARIEVERIAQQDLNPCFQALLLSHRLLPNIEGFEVHVRAASPAAVLTVPAAALALNVPVWVETLGIFDMMPFSTFLPTNLAARSSLEEPEVVARAVSWIAADDLLDALDGGPVVLDSEAVNLLVSRTTVITNALDACLALLHGPHQDWPAAVHRDVERFRERLEVLRAPLLARTLDTFGEVRRVRRAWTNLGPVPRHPNVEATPRGPGDLPRQPRRRQRPTDPSWLGI